MTKLSTIIDTSYCYDSPTPFVISPHLNLLLTTIKKAHGLGILVGGCVRDHLLGHGAADIDIEVYGIDADPLENLLAKHFSVMAVGKSFGIFKVIIDHEGIKETFDVALPRRENKSGQGHKGFVITTDPFMNFKDAAARRDFTINAMGLEPISQTILDPHQGRDHLAQKKLRHVSKAFSEDPLRVFRAAQFCARFDLDLDESTILLCQQLEPELKTLSLERIFGEMKKLLLAKKPSRGLLVLQATNALNLFVDLKNLINCPQDPEWHPEGDVWVHSLMVADQAAKLARRDGLNEEDHLIVVAGALCHDLGKPSCTIHKDGRIKSPGHEQGGAAPTLQFLSAMGMPQKYHDIIVSLVKEHLKPHQLYRTQSEVSDGAIRRLASRVDIEKLLYVSQADFLGRTTPEALAGVDPSASWLRQKSFDLLGQSLAPKPILLGRHLIALGEKPSAQFSRMLHDAFEAQLDGAFYDEASGIVWLKARLGKK